MQDGTVRLKMRSSNAPMLGAECECVPGGGGNASAGGNAGASGNAGARGDSGGWLLQGMGREGRGV